MNFYGALLVYMAILMTVIFVRMVWPAKPAPPSDEADERIRQEIANKLDNATDDIRGTL